MSLDTIEKLSIFRTNLFALGDLWTVWRAHLLFLMALLVWSLDLATIYPPGLLIITFEAHTLTEIHNMSVMNPPVPQNLEVSKNDSFPTLGTFYGLGSVFMSFESGDGEPDRRVLGYFYVN
jgi:hypothetical protein